MIAFVRERTGEDLTEVPTSNVEGGAARWLALLPRRIFGRFMQGWIRVWVHGLPAAFRAQNISFAAVGERHHWLWDFFQLDKTLTDIGFVDVQRHDCQSSSIPDFPFQPLDIDSQGQPRKGVGSMYIEARKPVSS